VTGSEGGTITIWQVGLAALPSFSSPNIQTGAASMFANGLPPILCGTADDIALCWGAESSPVPLVTHPEHGYIVSQAVHRDRGLVATSQWEGKLTISGLLAPSEPLVFDPGFNGWVRWTSNGHRLFVVRDTTKVFNVPDDPRLITPLETARFSGRLGGLYPLADGRVAVQNDKLLEVFGSEFEVSEKINGPDTCPRYSRFQPLAFSSRVDHAVLACDESVLLMEKSASDWKPRSNNPTWTMATTVGFDADAKVAVTGHLAGDAHLWSASSGAEVGSIRIGREVVKVDIVGSALIVGSSGGQLDYFDLVNKTRLGRSIVSAGGIVTTTRSGHFTKVGSAWPVIAFENGRRLNEEGMAGLASNEIVASELFKRDRYFVNFAAKIITSLRASWTWFTGQPVQEQALMLIGLGYLLFVGTLLSLWFVAPYRLCSWAFRLSDNSAAAVAESVKA
jgi:hypothetical protein